MPGTVEQQPAIIDHALHHAGRARKIGERQHAKTRRDYFPDAKEQDADSKEGTKATHSGLQRRPPALHNGSNDCACEKRAENNCVGAAFIWGFVFCHEKVNAKRESRRHWNGQERGGGVFFFLRAKRVPFRALSANLIRWHTANGHLALARDFLAWQHDSSVSDKINSANKRMS